jgi:glycopeptide antibiotics resistance protein
MNWIENGGTNVILFNELKINTKLKLIENISNSLTGSFIKLTPFREFHKIIWISYNQIFESLKNKG